MKPALALAAAIILAGCGKHSEPAGSTADAAGASGAAVDGSLPGTLSDLTQAVRRFGMEKRRVPKDLTEVISAGYLAELPPAPAGKKFAIDEKKVQVVLVNQ